MRFWPTPEAQLEAAALGTTGAERVAAEILADDGPDGRLALYETGELPTHRDVARALDAALAKRDAREPV